RTHNAGLARSRSAHADSFKITAHTPRIDTLGGARGVRVERQVAADAAEPALDPLHDLPAPAWRRRIFCRPSP
ncbi:hypothetical protein, partial [Xanthomonas graminis]|uniref:hypothetical protein n=1 Tax=Xanthomonas graminis TaxID=3390026 RepID=UPI001BAEC46E